MSNPAGPSDALVNAIAEASNQVTEGWMRLLAGLATPSGGAAGQPHALLASWIADLERESPRVAALQSNYLEKQARIWCGLLQGGAEPVVAPEPGDRRFAAREWRDAPYFDYLKQSYLLATRFVTELVEGAELGAKARERLRFAVKQWSDAVCPANFAATNPEVLRLALQSGGATLQQGLANLLADARRGRISQCDESAFEVGRNLAVTPGDVVYENELMQLVQYAAATSRVGTRPLVIVPPCINKYYILDLQPANSLVRHAVAQGHTVFVVSWRNVGPGQGHYRWDDYLEDGIFSAFRVARAIAGADRVNALGFCVGGTLLGAALAVLAAKDEHLIESVTYLTTMLDFSAPGQLGLFVDEASVAAREAAIGSGGILPGSDLAFAFSMLRANDLVWPYVVNNYLAGTTPAAFDLLYWNSDSTNLPGPMACYYLRNTYLENRLCVPGALENCGVGVNLGRVDRPSYILATREDHIVPWRAAYRTVHLLGGQKEFVLGASGHVAGVVNPAAKNRRSFWTRTAHGAGEPFPRDPEAWLAGATERGGSWWGHWTEWLSAFKGETRGAPARTGSGQYPAIEPAPGRYVMQKAPSPAALHDGRGRECGAG